MMERPKFCCKLLEKHPYLDYENEWPEEGYEFAGGLIDPNGNTTCGLMFWWEDPVTGEEELFPFRYCPFCGEKIEYELR